MKKIENLSTARLNNAEYTNFNQRVSRLIGTATLQKIGITADEYAAFNSNITLMTDVVAQSRVSSETAEIATKDRECDDLIRYIFGTIDAGTRSPLADQRAAAIALANLVKPYRGIQNMAQGQQIQQTRGMLFDLGKDANANHIDTLALGAGIQALRRANNEYSTLIDSRAASQSANTLPAGKEVRRQIDAQYERITTMAFVTSVASPSPEADAFITALNKLIADTKAAFNQRMAQTGGKEKEKEKE